MAGNNGLSTIPNFEKATLLEARSNAARSVRTTEARPSVVIGPAVFNNVNGLFQSYAPMAYMMPFELLDYIELLAIYNPDYSQAVENVRTLANPGHTLIVQATAGVATRLKQMFWEKDRQIQRRYGGVEGLIDKLLWQAAVHGAMAGEFVPNENLTDVVDFIEVNPKTIRFFWETEPELDPWNYGPHWAPYQRATAQQIVEAEAHGQPIKNGAYVKLNEVTFQYFAFNAAPGSPYGVPPFLAALNNLATQRDMVFNMSQVVKKLALFGLIDVKVSPLKMNPGETPDAFQARAQQYINQYAQQAESMLDDGGLVHFNDSEITATNLSSNAAGATNIFTQNEEQVFSGLKSMPSVQGRCLDPCTQILMVDASVKLLKDIVVGDFVQGFIENAPSLSYNYWRASRVENIWSVVKPAMTMSLANGRTITCGLDHPFAMVTSRWRQRSFIWKKAQDIRPGDRIHAVCGDSLQKNGCEVLSVELIGELPLIDLTTSTQTLIANGLLTHNSYSTTETYAGVAYDIMIRNSIRYQRAAKMMIEYGYYLMAQLWNEKVQRIDLKFWQNKSLQRRETAQAEHYEILNQMFLWATGITNQVDMSHNLGYADPDTPLDEIPNNPLFTASSALKGINDDIERESGRTSKPAGKREEKDDGADDAS